MLQERLEPLRARPWPWIAYKKSQERPGQALQVDDGGGEIGLDGDVRQAAARRAPQAVLGLGLAVHALDPGAVAGGRRPVLGQLAVETGSNGVRHALLRC